MDGWGIAATLFAAGAFGLGLWELLRRWRARPSYSWTTQTAWRKVDPSRHRISLQLIADAPAYHVTVDGAGLDLDQQHHDHANERQDWPHLGSVNPVDPPLVVYVVENNEHPQPHVRVVWQVPPLRRERFFEQLVYVGGEDAPHPPPYEQRDSPWWRRHWRHLSSS